MTNIMLDIETLSAHPTDAVVLSIGVMSFIMREAAPTMTGHGLWVLSLNEQIADGRDISAETLDFWAAQPPAAREHWRNVEAIPVISALSRLTAFIQPNPKPDYPPIWANGICFDIGNLESLYRAYSMSIPWRYNDVRDARTIYRVLPKLRERPPYADTGTAHDPIADCNKQIWGLWERWTAFEAPDANGKIS